MSEPSREEALYQALCRQGVSLSHEEARIALAALPIEREGTLDFAHIPIERHWGLSMRLHEALGHTEPWEMCEAGCDSLASDAIRILFEREVEQASGDDTHATEALGTGLPGNRGGTYTRTNPSPTGAASVRGASGPSAPAESPVGERPGWACAPLEPPVEEVRCPDGGACWHYCAEHYRGACWRVFNASPLSVSGWEAWPADVKAAQHAKLRAESPVERTGSFLPLVASALSWKEGAIQAVVDRCDPHWQEVVRWAIEEYERQRVP